MPRNSQGLYSLPAGNPVVPGTVIESAWANPTMSDIAEALTLSLPRDGSAPMTGPLTLTSGAPTQPRHAVSKAYVEQFLAFSTGLPIGFICPFAGTINPGGWLLCNGQAVSRTTYADLFALIGTIFGAGDGSTTFNVPDLRNEFIRGLLAPRTVGSKQVGSFATHSHGVLDPGHGHGININSGGQSQDHSHAISVNITPVGDHAHTIPLSAGGTFGLNFAAGRVDAFAGNINSGLGGGHGHAASASAGGATAGHFHNIFGSTGGSGTGISLGFSGGSETVPQNIAFDFYIKAVNDAVGPVSITGIDSDDLNMISIDNTNPVVPVLNIHSNVAFGIPKLDASGKIPISLLPLTGTAYLGYFDASGNQNPSEKYPLTNFSAGDFYIISVAGTILVYDPVTLLPSPTVVNVGDTIAYVENSSTNPTGWYKAAAAASTPAINVTFAPFGNIGATNVQDAIEELDTEKAPMSAATAGGTSLVPVGVFSATDVQAGFAEIDAELSLKQDALTAVQKDSSIGGAFIPAGTNAERPVAPVFGQQRANTSTGAMEWFNGVAWVPMGGGATGGGANQVFYENDQTVTVNYTITSGKNAMSAGPISINNGVTVTVPNGSVWTVV